MDSRPIDKLMLMMLSDISKSLKIKGEIDPDFVMEAVTNDHMWGLSWKYSSLCSTREPYPAVVEETCDILNMWRRIERSLKQLSANDRQEVEAAVGTHSMQFQGFDANNDAHYGVLRFLVDHLDLYSERDPVLNSHSTASLPHYRHMLGVLADAPTSPFELSKTGLIAVLQGGR